MRFHNWHFNWIFTTNREIHFLFGVATGRVSYFPNAKWLYSFRVFLGIFKFEILWTSGQL
jgi:hypothetical protein